MAEPPTGLPAVPTYRVLRRWLFPAGSRREALVRLLLSRVRRLLAPVGDEYARWLRLHAPTADRLALWRVEARSFAHPLLISIVVHTPGPDVSALRRTIDSVRSQAYERWELCVVSDASSAPQVRPVLAEYVAADSRIKVRHLEGTLGAAGRANHALAQAGGDFVGFLDVDGELYPHALYRMARVLDEHPSYDVIYSDEDRIDRRGQRTEPYFKSDWSPDLLLSMNYLSRFVVYRRTLLDALQGLRPGFDGSEDYDLALRVTERTHRIGHVPDVLYGSRTAPPPATDGGDADPGLQAAERALADALRRRDQEGRVERVAPGRFLIRYTLRATPKVSILIPMRDRAALTRQCIASIEEKSRYRQFEIVVIDNASTDPESLTFLEGMALRHRVVRYPHPFNFAAINNFGVTQATGEVLVFLNNDTEVVTEDWLEAMLEHAQRPEIGAVGAKLLYPDGRIQHAGVAIFGTPTCFASHVFKDLPEGTGTYFGVAQVIRNVVAVTAACLMVRRHVFEELEGMDERLGVAFNDTDFCLRLRERGYLVVYTPAARLIHHESASRGALHPEENERFVRERWEGLIRRGDPYYNPHLTVIANDFTLRA